MIEAPSWGGIAGTHPVKTQNSVRSSNRPDSDNGLSNHRQNFRYQSSPQSSMTTFFEGVPLEEPTFSIFLTTSSYPSRTSPNTTCFPSRCGVFFTVMKNCEPLVSLPALAMLNNPGLTCLSLKFSSLNFSP